MKKQGPNHSCPKHNCPPNGRGKLEKLSLWHFCRHVLNPTEQEGFDRAYMGVSFSWGPPKWWLSFWFPFRHHKISGTHSPKYRPIWTEKRRPSIGQGAHRTFGRFGTTILRYQDSSQVEHDPFSTFRLSPLKTKLPLSE